MAGKTFPAFPVHAQPAFLRFWQEAHDLRIRMALLLDMVLVLHITDNVQEICCIIQVVTFQNGIPNRNLAQGVNAVKISLLGR